MEGATDCAFRSLFLSLVVVSSVFSQRCGLHRNEKRCGRMHCSLFVGRLLAASFSIIHTLQMSKILIKTSFFLCICVRIQRWTVFLARDGSDAGTQRGRLGSERRAVQPRRVEAARRGTAEPTVGV